MQDELFSLRVMVVSAPGDERDLICQALSSLSVPIEVAVADGATSAVADLPGTDIIYLDGDLPAADIRTIVAAARGSPHTPFTVQLTALATPGQPFESDALAGKPSRPSEAKWLIERSVRVRLPSRVLLVDDSPTMRNIVRKLLAKSRFKLDVIEAGEGFAALKLAREHEIDFVFLDYNMPDFSGLETLAEFKREKRRVDVVIMTSLADESLAERARAEGAAFLKKPFFPADVDAALGGFYGLRALNPKRA